jgi:hypothetical protein
VRDDEGYEQFEILFASSGTGKKKRTGARKLKEYGSVIANCHYYKYKNKIPKYCIPHLT